MQLLRERHGGRQAANQKALPLFLGNQTEILQGHHINQTESKIGLNAFERATAAAKI
jgi:hypothetical protein